MIHGNTHRKLFLCDQFNATLTHEGETMFRLVIDGLQVFRGSSADCISRAFDEVTTAKNLGIDVATQVQQLRFGKWVNTYVVRIQAGELSAVCS